MSDDGAGPSRIDYSDGFDVSASHFVSSGGFGAGGWLAVATGEASSGKVAPSPQAPLPRPAASKANDTSVWFFEEEESSDGHHSSADGGDVGEPVAAARPQAAPVPQPQATERAKAAVPSNSDAVLSRMYHDAMDRKLARQQWACLERAKLQMLEAARNPCTFKPRLSSYAKGIRRPKSLSPQNRAQDELRRKMEWRSARKAAAIEEDLAECTFKPLTLSAAKLHASALLHESHLFSKLHAHAAEVKAFKEKIVEQAANELENKMAHKGSGKTQHVLTEEEVRDVVQRLVSGGAKLSLPPAEQRDEFRPTLDANSQALVEKRRRRSPETPQDVVERLLAHSHAEPPQRPSISRSESAEVGSANGRGGSAERRDPRIPALVSLYRLLAEACIARASGQPKAPEISEEQLAQMTLPAAAIARAAVDVLPVDDADELVAMLTANVSDAQKLSSAEFVQMTLREIRRTGPKQFVWAVQAESRRRRSEAPGEFEQKAKPVISKRSSELALARHRSAAASGVEVVERLQRQHELKQERQRQISVAAEEDRLRRELAECTFRPQFTTYRPSTARTSNSRAAHNSSSEKEANDVAHATLSAPSSDVSMQEPPPTSKLAEPARPSLHVRSASSGGVSSSFSPAIRRLSGSLSPMAHGISECVAFDSPEGLKQYGAELMRRQLERKKKLAV